MNRGKIHVKLVYDSENAENLKELREVGFVKAKPVEQRVHLDKTGQRATVDLKINALTSQHDQSLFRLLFQYEDLEKKQLHSAISKPIKVIAKILNNRKKRKSEEISNSPTPSTPTIVEKQHSPELPPTSDDFESIFLKLISAYNQIPQEERAPKIRKIVSSASTTELPLQEFVDLLIETSTITSNTCFQKPEMDSFYDAMLLPTAIQFQA